MSDTKKPAAKLKTLTIRLTPKVQYIVLLAVLLGLIGTTVFAYMEMSNMRRDLYAVRGDYYGVSDYASEDYGVDFEIVSQEVKKLRIVDDNYQSAGKYYEEPVYKKADVRVLEVRLKNNLDYTYSYYGSLAQVNESGVISRGNVTIHPDDELNTWGEYGTLELAKDGETTIYVYFLDDGNEITNLIDADNYY